MCKKSADSLSEMPGSVASDYGIQTNQFGDRRFLQCLFQIKTAVFRKRACISQASLALRQSHNLRNFPQGSALGIRA